MKQQYYNIANILAKKAHYNLIYGERSNGKSYAVKVECLKRFRDFGAEFMYIRRYDTDIKIDLVNGYFADVPLKEIFGDKYNTIYAHAGRIYLARVGEDGKKSDVIQCGYYRALNVAQRYSSTAYPNVQNIILEEFISLNGEYLSNELFLFNHIISTVARRRDICVFMIANSISRISPYWREYGVNDIIQTQKQGTIEVIERQTDGGAQIVAVEYCANTAQRSKMFSGARQDMTNGGKWLAQDYPKLPTPRAEWECLYTFVVQYKDFKFLVEYLSSGGAYCLYATPKTTPIKPNTRVLTDRASVDPLTTTGLIPLNNKERAVFAMLTSGKTFFSDNLTGTEFSECVRQLKRGALVDK